MYTQQRFSSIWYQTRHILNIFPQTLEFIITFWRPSWKFHFFYNESVWNSNLPYNFTIFSSFSSIWYQTVPNLKTFPKTLDFFILFWRPSWKYCFFYIVTIYIMTYHIISQSPHHSLQFDTKHTLFSKHFPKL